MCTTSAAAPRRGRSLFFCFGPLRAGVGWFVRRGLLAGSRRLGRRDFLERGLGLEHLFRGARGPVRFLLRFIAVEGRDIDIP